MAHNLSAPPITHWEYIGRNLSESGAVDYDQSEDAPMAIDLSDEQRQAFDAGAAVPIYDGPKTYYVISDGQFEKMKALLEVAQADPSFYEVGEIHLH